MLLGIRPFKRSGPTRFFKMTAGWILLAVLSVLVAGAIGQPPDFLRLGLGAVAIFGPLVLKMLMSLRHYVSPVDAFVFTTYFFLFASYRGLALRWDAQIWLGRVSIFLGFAVTLASILYLFF